MDPFTSLHMSVLRLAPLLIDVYKQNDDYFSWKELDFCFADESELRACVEKACLRLIEESSYVCSSTFDERMLNYFDFARWDKIGEFTSIFGKPVRSYHRAVLEISRIEFAICPNIELSDLADLEQLESLPDKLKAEARLTLARDLVFEESNAAFSALDTAWRALRSSQNGSASERHSGVAVPRLEVTSNDSDKAADDDIPELDLDAVNDTGQNVWVQPYVVVELFLEARQKLKRSEPTIERLTEHRKNTKRKRDHEDSNGLYFRHAPDAKATDSPYYYRPRIVEIIALRTKQSQ